MSVSAMIVCAQNTGDGDSPVAKAVTVPPPMFNLLDNGDFSDWPDEAVFPPYWSGEGNTTDRKASWKIERFDTLTYDGRYAAKQTWSQPDDKLAVLDRFGVTVNKLKPNSSYRLSLKAWNQSQAPVSVQVWTLDASAGASADASPKPLVSSLIEIAPSHEFEDYSALFTVGDKASIRIVTSYPSGTTPASTVWDAWVLEEANDLVWPMAVSVDTFNSDEALSDTVKRSMRLVANLVPYSNFASWPTDGSLAPGWGLYSGRERPYTVSRYTGKTPFGQAILQTWNHADADASVYQLFGPTVEDLDPDTVYRLMFSAYNQSDNSVFVQPWEVGKKDGEPVRCLASPFIEVKSAPKCGFVRYYAAFKTGTGSRVKLAISTDAASFPVSIAWCNWSLMRVGSMR